MLTPVPARSPFPPKYPLYPHSAAAEEPPDKLQNFAFTGGVVKLSYMAEVHTFPPPPEFARRAQISGIDARNALYDEAARHPGDFWGTLAEQELHWFRKWTSVFDWQAPNVRWFSGATTNACYNCVDRHLLTH